MNKKKQVIFLALFLALGLTLMAQGPNQPPLTEKEVIHELKSGVSPDQLSSLLAQRGVDFDMTPEIEKRLRKAGANDAEISSIERAGPKARAAARQAGGPQMSPEEVKAVQLIQNELDPDRQIQMVQDFEKNYPKSTWLTYAYVMGAGAYQQKGDAEHSLEFAEKSLKLKDDNLLGLVLMAYMLPQPQLLHGGDADREKKLADAETYANKALQLVDKLQKQPNQTDEQFQKSKSSLASQLHASLGLVHLERSSGGLTGPDKDELAKAEQEYKLAVSLTDRPEPSYYFRLGEAYSSDGKLDEAIEAFTKTSELGQGTVVKTYADQRIEEIKKRKAQPKVSATP